MKSAFNKNSKPGDIGNFVMKTLFGPQGYQDALETIALSVLPLLTQSRAGLESKARNIPMLYDMIMGDLDAGDISHKITSISRAQVDDFVEKAFAGEKDDLKRARSLRAKILSFPSREKYLAFSDAMESVLPPAMAQASSKTGNAGDVYDQLGTLSDEDIAAALAERRKRQPAGQLAEGIYALMQQCTPERVGALVEHINENLGGAGMALLVKRFWDFADETLSAADKGDFMAAANPSKVKAFGRTLRDALTTLEEGLEAAGFTIPPALRASLKEDFGTGNLLREALGQRAGASVKDGLDDGIAVAKPLQLKRPNP